MPDVAEVPESIKGTWLEEAARRADEPLDPELVPYLYDSDGLFEGSKCLKHPLVYEVPFWPQLAYRANDQLKHKREAVAEAVREQSWGQVIWLHERPHRFAAFDEIKRKLSHKLYWELLGAVWTDSENIWQQMHLVPQLMGSQRPGRRHIMDAADYRKLQGMAETFLVYRGYAAPRGTRAGWSWTLSEDKARWFSERLVRPGETPTVLTGLVRKSNVIAYFTGRNEEEIVINPRDLLLPVLAT